MVKSFSEFKDKENLSRGFQRGRFPRYANARFTKREEVDTAEAIIEKKETRLA